MDDAVVRPVRIGSRKIAPGEPVFVIAEAGVNHNGDVELACALVEAAADAGADAVKFQTFVADQVASRTAPKAAYQLTTTDPAESQQALLKRLELGCKDFEIVQARCIARGILFLSTPFDVPSVDLLDAMGVPAFKVPSGEVTNVPFLRHVARKGKPVLMSTGMCDLAEVEAAVVVLRQAGCAELALLHCVTSYPAPPHEVNLRAMGTLQHAIRVPVGFSDHTNGCAIALAATALGACVIEKHLTVDRHLPGPDHAASLEPAEFRALVRDVRSVEQSLGDGEKRPAPSETANRDIVRRSLAAAADVPVGTPLRAELLTALRPGTGLPPAAIDRLIGRRAARDLRAGELLGWSDVE